MNFENAILISFWAFSLDLSKVFITAGQKTLFHLIRKISKRNQCPNSSAGYDRIADSL